MGVRIAVAAVLVLVLVSGCAPRIASTPKPAPAPKSSRGETAFEAARRLFPQEYEEILAATEDPEVLEGATVGEPVPGSKDYFMMSPLIVQWVLSDDLNAVGGDMFSQMKPAVMRDDYYFVPMVKGGVSVCEFEIALNEQGRWEWSGSLTDPLPGGQVYYFQQAKAELESVLGTGTEVRPAIFLPSGLAFAVGNNGKREAAVYLTFTNHGEGVGSFDKSLPETGTFYTPAELKTLLTP